MTPPEKRSTENTMLARSVKICVNPRPISYRIGGKVGEAMNIRKAVITAAGRNQRTLPVQAIVDRDGTEKSVLGILVEEALVLPGLSLKPRYRPIAVLLDKQNVRKTAAHFEGIVHYMWWNASLRSLPAARSQASCRANPDSIGVGQRSPRLCAWAMSSTRCSAAPGRRWMVHALPH